MEIDKLCRGCLREDDNMLDMSAKAIYEKFLLFANLIAEEEIPDIPLNLCRSCEQKLNSALDFKEKCQNSHEVLLNYVKNTREVKTEVTDADQVDSEAQITLNNLKNTHEVDLEAADVEKPTHNQLLLEKFSQFKVWKAIEELKQSFYKNKNCIFCSYVGDNSRSLSIHISRLHKNLKPRWCCSCNAEFDNLTDHVATNHQDDYICKFCSRKFYIIGHLTEHLWSHSDVKPFPCSFCESCFIKQSHLNEHLRKHTKKKPFKCSSCDKSFTQSHSLKTHLKTHESEGDAVKQPASVELKKYKPVPTSTAPHKCTDCDKKFNARSNLLVHKRIHIKKISCNICNKKFCDRYLLRIHLRRHTGEKPFVCNECGMAFIQNSHLAEHKRTHSNVRPYQCNNCDKSFREKTHLKRHMLIHSGEMPFKCNQCSYACRQSNKLTLHMKKHVVDKPEQIDYTCV